MLVRAAALKALRPVPKSDFPFPSGPCPRTFFVQSYAAVAHQFEALPTVPISRALCTEDASLNLDLKRGSEMFSSFWGLLRRTWFFLTIFAPPSQGCIYVNYREGQRARECPGSRVRSSVHVLDHPIESGAKARGSR